MIAVLVIWFVLAVLVVTGLARVQLLNRRAPSSPLAKIESSFGSCDRALATHEDAGDVNDYAVPEGLGVESVPAPHALEAYRIKRRNPRLTWELAQAVAEARARTRRMA